MGRFSSLGRGLGEYGEWAKMAQAQTGKALPTQVREILALKRVGGQCGISDYYWHRLYDDDYLKGKGREDFLGWRLLESFSRSLNPRNAVLPAWDKSAFALSADAAGLPIAHTDACFHPAGKIAPIFGRHLRTIDMAREYLLDPSVYPLFGKPAYSQGGHGAVYMMDINLEEQTVLLPEGKTIPLEELLQSLVETVDYRYHRPQCGYLFQTPLASSSAIKELTGWPAVCSARVICLNHAGQVTPIRCALKLALPPNLTDNFGMGDHGNLLANIDPESGVIDTTIGGLWPKTQVYETHPSTGAQLEGFRIPQWNRVIDACVEAGKVFPLMKVHHWDIAITEDGPIMMELNDIGGTQIAQMHGHGLLTEETRAFLKQHANQQQHPWVSAL